MLNLPAVLSIAQADELYFEETASDAAQLARLGKALRLLTAPFPYLSGLAAATRVVLDERVPTMGVFASGRLAANRQFVQRLNDNELMFVLAHEMLHLALRTHDRAKGSSRLEFNYAHDYIINDILRHELGVQRIPANGLDMAGARDKSAEAIVLEMRRAQAQQQTRTQVWDGQSITVRRLFGGGRRQGLEDSGDVLDAVRERELFPADAADQKRQADAVKAAAAKSLALAKLMGGLRGLHGSDAGSSRQMVTALRGIYRAPWQIALQRWAESASAGERTFSRPSRRSAERQDVVLPGRRRDSWLLNIVLDTSGSMGEEIPRVLGAIGEFCDAQGLDQVRLIQCDTEVTADEWLAPAELAQHAISGYGGSDLSPALRYLANDPEVRAVVVVTDGDIELPNEPMPFQVLWALPVASGMFRPPYGQVITLE